MTSLLSVKIISIVLALVILVCVYFEILLLLRWRKEKDSQESSLKTALKKLKRNEAVKEQEYNALVEEEGYQEKMKFQIRFNQMLLQSGLKAKAPDAPVALYLLGFIAIALIGFEITYLLTRRIIYGAVAGIAVLIIIHTILQLLAARIFRQMDKDLRSFVNFTDSNSIATDDVVTIIYQAGRNLGEPLKKYTEDFYRDAMNYSKAKAFENLEQKIPHEMLRELIHNLYICSIYNSDYRAVLSDARENVDAYMDGKAQRRAVRQTQKVNILIVIAASLFCLHITSQMAESGNIFKQLNGSTAGSVLLGGFILSVLYAIYNLIRADKL